MSDVMSNDEPEEQMEQNPILTCRRKSRSIWLHFPHLELLFLFWAFEGAVAAQVSAIRTAECPWVFWLALAALVRAKFTRFSFTRSADKTKIRLFGSLIVVWSVARQTFTAEGLSRFVRCCIADMMRAPCLNEARADEESRSVGDYV